MEPVTVTVALPPPLATACCPLFFQTIMAVDSNVDSNVWHETGTVPVKNWPGILNAKGFSAPAAPVLDWPTSNELARSKGGKATVAHT